MDILQSLIVMVLGVKFNDMLSKKFPYKEKINTMISTNNSDIKLK